MTLIRKVRGKMPAHGQNCWFADNATIVGDVVMGNECSVWFNAVIRGDVHYIKMGNRVNVQDGAVIHCTYEKSPTEIGDNVSIGHNAIVHGCIIHDEVLIGMGAIVMDDCVVEKGSIIAAGAVLVKGTHVKARSLYAGVPAKFVKEVGNDLRTGEIERIARNYAMYSEWYKEEER